jgi:hypothetical protein
MRSVIRPFAMVRADLSYIAEVKLFCAGFFFVFVSKNITN